MSTLLALVLAGGSGCISSGGSTSSVSTVSTQFANPQAVTIAGYSGEAMEPFLSRDGKYLFFNDLNTGPTTRLYYAIQIDPLHFQFQGEIGGVNTAQLDAVSSLDVLGNFYFISNRSYAQNLSTLYSGTFAGGNVTAVAPVPGISAPAAGLVDFDAEISADGNTLYFSEGPLNNSGQAQSAQIIVATRGASGFTRLPQSATIMQQINNGLSYAADVSASELEIFFTRGVPGSGPAIYTATRSDKSSAFGPPAKIVAITGFAEAPSLSPDGKSLYYHLWSSTGQFVIYRATRP